MAKKGKDQKTEQLKQTIRRAFARAREEREAIVVPAWISAEAYTVLDPERAAPILVQWAATLQLRQFAREVCRGELAEQERQAEFVDDDGTWAGHLQEMYPANRRLGDEEQEVYVRREYLTDPEIDANIRRLEREGQAKLGHARALLAFKESRTGNEGQSLLSPSPTLAEEDQPI